MARFASHSLADVPRSAPMSPVDPKADIGAKSRNTDMVVVDYAGHDRARPQHSPRLIELGGMGARRVPHACGAAYLAIPKKRRPECCG